MRLPLLRRLFTLSPAHLVTLSLLLGTIAMTVYFAAGASGAAPAESSSQMLVHNVYFTLKDPSPEAQQKLVAACHKYLSSHPGTVYYAAGTLVEELKREVNDRDFHVGLHLVFKDKAAHDKYQDAPQHLKFIEENKATWKKVRVFDSYASGAAK
jgi:quinol monooxygenase YgiN